MTQQPMSQQELAELEELLQLTQETEKKSQKLADLTLAIDKKYEKRIAEIRLARKLQAMKIINETPIK